MNRSFFNNKCCLEVSWFQNKVHLVLKDWMSRALQHRDWLQCRCCPPATHLLWRKFKSQKILYNFWQWFLALFTKPIKNWGVPEMIYCKFLLWSKNCRWNRVKMVKNGTKMAKIILRAYHMINNNIFFSFLVFQLFPLNTF